ncbi:MAG: GGDEF domain-containing protein [Acidobacteria bacterium]|nr:GGDEF domain-containing protein [Acidobacteriota bacterium]
MTPFSPRPTRDVVVTSTPAPSTRRWYRRGPWSLLARDALVQSVIAACVLTTLVTNFVLYPHRRYHVSLDGALYLVAVTLPALAMLITARRSPEVRRPWLVMAAGVVLNGVADVVYAAHDARRHPIPDPGVSDVFYLAAYLSFVLAVILLTRASGDRVRASLRLDGLIATAAVASLVAFIWYVPLTARGGGIGLVVVDMAYPMLDLVMLMLLVTALAGFHYRPTWSSGLLIGGVVWFILGDVLHVSEIATHTVHAVSLTNMSFVVGTWLIGLAASLHDQRRPRHGRREEASLSVAAVPVVAGVIALGVIAASWAWRRPPEVGALALAALALMMVRMWLALREERRLVLSSSHDARTDALTGLANRRKLFELIEQLRGTGAPFGVGVILIDLDGFKEVNDEIGHAAGDELLRVISQRFVRRLADRGTLARLGGDEFAVVRVGAANDLVSLARELLATTDEEFALQGHHIRLSASLGVAVDPAADPFELLRRADVAMYRAKRERTGVSIFVASDEATPGRTPRSHTAGSALTREGSPSRAT